MEVTRVSFLLGEIYPKILQESHQPDGFLDLYVFPDTAHGNNVGLVNNLVIDERFRGRGLGEGLLGEAIEHCRRGDVAELHVWTGADNIAAIGLYRKAGFAERAVLMELEVRPGYLAT